MACSFDGKRLFGAYRSGGIAVVMESEGHGSVITPTGECILNIHVVDSNFVADLQSDDGQLLSRYVKSHSSVKTKPQEWKFQELQISFFPDIWEVAL